MFVEKHLNFLSNNPDANNKSIVDSEISLTAIMVLSTALIQLYSIIIEDLAQSNSP